MSLDAGRPVDRAPRGRFRVPQALVSGLVLIALASFAVWAIGNLPQGTLRAMGPAMLPRWLAIAVGACGVALVAAAFLKADGETLQRGDYAGVAAVAAVIALAAFATAVAGISFIAAGLVIFYVVLACLFVLALRNDPWLNASGLRGPFFVLAGVLTFAITIRPFPIGTVTTPGLGLIAAGPLAMLIAGFATPEVRLRELLILALALTALCMLLFGDMLNLPIPLFPLSLSALFPEGASQKTMLRVTAAVLIALAAAVFFSGRRGGSPTIDVADHSGRI